MKNEPLLIGIDGGATKVSAWEIVHDKKNSTFSLGEINSTKSYREVKGYISDFEPVDINVQLGEKECPNPTSRERQQAAVCAQACAMAIAELASKKGNADVLIGIGMPGLKTENKRGIAVLANGPRMIDYSDRLEKCLTELNINLTAPVDHLGSDADYCGIGENYSEEGRFRTCENGYYLGGGTGVADAMKLDGKLLTFDNVRTWMAKTWEMMTAEGMSLEKVTSVSGIQNTYAEFANQPVEELSSKGIYPLQISELAYNGNKAALKTFTVVNQNLSKLLFERILTLNMGWHNSFEFGNSNRPVPNKKHAYLGKMFDSLVIGQRLGDLFVDKCGSEVVKNPVIKQLNHLIQASDLLPDHVKSHYGNLGEILCISKLREAPALGAGIDAFLTVNS